eukprot:g2645.t2
MEPLESPRVAVVGGVLSRGEDTDGERTDDEVDFPSEPSYISQHQDEEGEVEPQDELEVTGEGTAGGPFGLKKVLFVRKKSEKGVSSKEEPSFKDRFSKLGAGVGEKFAAFGSILQEHGSSKNTAAATAAGGTAPNVAEGASTADGTTNENGTARVGPPQGASPPAPPPVADQPPQLAMEYFQEYELEFSSRPKFSVVGGPGGKGAVVSWEGVDVAAPGGNAVPPTGAAVIAVSGRSVADSTPEEVTALLAVGSGGDGEGDGDGDASESRRKQQQSTSTAAAATDAAAADNGSGEPLVVRFREKTGPGGARQQDPGTPGTGGEVFRTKMKAMATGLGNFFQVKDSAVRDGTLSAGDTDGAPSSSSASADAFVLTFSARGGTAEELPFTLAEMVGGLGVLVTAVREDYAESLVKAEEAGVVSARVAGVTPAAAAAAAAGERAGGGVSQAGNGARGAVLEPGALLLRVAGQNVEGKGLQRVRQVLEAAAAEHLAVKILFRNAPPIYRASVAAELALEHSKAPHVHVGTWQPLLKRRAGVTLGGGGDGENGGGGGGGGGGRIGLGYGGEEWEDVQTTMARAHRFVNGFRSVGIRVDVLSMQTVTLPRTISSAYAGTFEGRPSSFQQAVRLWFSFPDERTVSLPRQPTLEKLGLLHVDTTGVGLGAWVTVAAADASPCADAGVPVGENSILTHVNGFDVSPPAYRSLAPLPFGEGHGWAAAVLPALESGGGDRITLTFV